MKVVLLAGGFGTRITEESVNKPKPMIEIGGMPILWHIMKEYSYYGFYEFIICAGYRQHVIKNFFADYYLHRSDVIFDFSSENPMQVYKSEAEPWKVSVIDTGLHTCTGGRIKRVKDYIGDETFCLTYGDGVCDVNMKELIHFHNEHKKIATLTAVQPGGRFGSLKINSDAVVESFAEKRKSDGGWINGGYMVLEPEVFEYIDGDGTVFEKEPLEKLAAKGQLAAYKYDGFWQCMDTLRDKIRLEELLSCGKAPWKKWDICGGKDEYKFSF